MVTISRTSALRLIDRFYWPRIISLAFVILAIGGIFLQKQMSIWPWFLLLLYGLIWPHIANFWAKRSKDPFKSEQINLFVDAFFMGFWVPLISFDFVPSIAVIVMGLLSVVSALGFKKMIFAFIIECIGVLVACLIFGINIQFQNNMYSTMISLPILCLYPLFVGNVSYQLSLNISDKKRQLKTLSRTDALTGLNNRRYLEDQLEQLFKRNKRDKTKACFVFIDFDHFKAVNDTHGHLVGDAVLKKVADIIQSCVREVDICGRFGGEEFCILMPNTQAEEAKVVAERIRESINQTVLHQEKQVTGSVSSGVAVISNSMACYNDWLALADKAQYRAKELGRNQTVIAAST